MNKQLVQTDRRTEPGGSQDLWQVGPERSSQFVAMTIAILFTTTLAYFAGPMLPILYGVVCILPATLLVSVFPNSMCISFSGINLTSKRSDISWTLLFWGYWVLLSYVFFMVEFTVPFYLWYVLPLNLLQFGLATFSRTSCFRFFVILNVILLLIPSADSGIFREEYWVTIVRVVVYFVGFYVVEHVTKTSGLNMIVYLGWILMVWKWLMPLFVLQVAYLAFMEYRSGTDAPGDPDPYKFAHVPTSPSKWSSSRATPSYSALASEPSRTTPQRAPKKASTPHGKAAKKAAPKKPSGRLSTVEVVVQRGEDDGRGYGSSDDDDEGLRLSGGADEDTDNEEED